MNHQNLFKKGAEASLYTATWKHRRVVIKKRLPKKYRSSRLDDAIRTYRTIHEPRLIHEAKRVGVSTPIVLLVDVKNSAIVMEYIEGKQVKQVLKKTSKRRRRQLCLQIGKMIGKLHEGGIVHGDLTTSNMILDSSGRMTFVDFGLGEKTNELEARGVDLHLMKRALQSTHFDIARESFEAIIEGYSKVLGSELVRNVKDKVKEIETRGRYVAERKV